MLYFSVLAFSSRYTIIAHGLYRQRLTERENGCKQTNCSRADEVYSIWPHYPLFPLPSMARE